MNTNLSFIPVEFDLQILDTTPNLLKWLLNLGVGNWVPLYNETNGRVIGISFCNIEDAIAFKLKFNI